MRLIATLFAVMVSIPSISFAESGSTLRIYKDTGVLVPTKEQPAEMQRVDEEGASAETGESDSVGPLVYIETISVIGNTTLPEDKINQIIEPFVGRNLSTTEIHEVSDSLMDALRKAGAFTAKVYILPQDIDDNRLVLNIMEGHLAEDGILLSHSSNRVKDDVITDQLENTLNPGSKLTAKKYERAVLLTNDLPGIKKTKNLIFPADNVGEAGFAVSPEDENLVTGSLYYDNFGSYFTGRNRWGGTAQLNSPSGHAERLIAGGNISDYGTVFGYTDFSLPLYPNGLRGGVTLDFLNYKTDQPNDLRGTGLDGSLYLYYPIIRSRLKNLHSELRYTYTALDDENDLGTITDRVLNVGSLNFYGDVADSFFGGGVTTAKLEGFLGDVNLDGYEPFKEFDAFTADTQGSFSRMTLSLTRLQHLVGDLQAYIAFNSQFASKRMDPAQSIAFGGPYNFPGYQVGDIFGDDGWMIHTDLRYNFKAPPWNGNLQASVYYDYGWIKTHTAAVVGGFPVPGAEDKGYHLQSAGAGLSQIWEHFILQGLVGWQIDNQIPDTLLDDGGKDDFQAWIHLVYLF